MTIRGRLHRSTVGIRLGAVVLLFPLLASQGVLAGQAEVLLEQMSEAVEYLNFEGTLVYMRPGHAETFKVFHRVDDQGVSERLVALDGERVEIIRSSEGLICIFPEQKAVVVEKREDKGKKANPLYASIPTYSESVPEHYELQVFAADRVLGRPVAVIGITPRDDFRYGYRLWLDEETGMPLKSQLIGEDEHMPVEEIRFTEIRLPTMVAKEAVVSDLDTSEFDWTTQSDTSAGTGSSDPPETWRAGELPRGFMLTMETQQYTGSGVFPRIQLVYSDGLASVSVFIDKGVAAAEQAEGLTMIGAANAFSVIVDGQLVTAFGEVPPKTVELIANSTRLISPQ
jgi:sigma-E factor negative regulatory protein RseB